MVITTKYISASLLTVLRILDLFMRCLDLMTWVFTRMITKTVTSMGMAGWINGRNFLGGEGSDTTPTKNKREEHLNERGNPFDTGKT